MPERQPTSATTPRVARIITRLNVGGPAIHVSLLTRGLEGRYRTTLVVGSLFEGEADMADLVEGADVRRIEALRRDGTWTDGIRAFWSCLRLLRKFQPDLVHTHLSHAGVHGRLAAATLNAFRWVPGLGSGRRIHIVHTFHGHVFQGHFSSIQSRLYRAFERLLSLLSDRIVALSPGQRDDLVDRFRIAPASKVVVIPLGFDFDWTRGLPQRLTRRSAAAPPRWTIGIIGRVVPVKNHGLFLESMQQLVRTLPDVHALIIGDGPDRPGHVSWCDEQGLLSFVTFVGWMRDRAEMFAGIDCLAVTSHSEGTPVAAIEAMASGVPLVCTEVGGIPDLLGAVERRPRAGVSIRERGIGVEPGNVDALTAALKLVAEDTEGAERRARAACTYAVENHSAERLLHDVDSLYAALLNRNDSAKRAGPRLAHTRGQRS